MRTLGRQRIVFRAGPELLPTLLRLLDPLPVRGEIAVEAVIGSVRDANVERLEQELADKLGARVAIQEGSGGKGKLVVSYNSLDELDGILAHIQ